MNESNVRIQVSKLCKSFARHHVLRDVEWSIAAGTVVGLLGTDLESQNKMEIRLVATVARRWTVKRNASTVWRRWLLLFVSVLMSSGCTYSTNPIFVEQDNLFDEAFLGTWEAEQEAKFEFRRFEVIRSGPGEKSYRAVLRNETGEKQEPSFQLFLSQIDGKKFITAKFEQPSSEKASPDTPAAAAIYLTFAMDRCEDGELSVRYLRADWLAGQVKKNPSILKHAWIPRPGNREKSDLRLTAPTDELRTFVLGQLDKREAWMPVIFKKIR